MKEEFIIAIVFGLFFIMSAMFIFETVLIMAGR